ncbi:DEKNAAC102599 [Brettanomyces naardenensis]|uniref:Genetic interactor of prohibitins 3, mitochondrial n=1 Tax=Brettanomyces naardenensis TaxID=13370 RepID=A0A448YLI9_BRENA|nr:DEKNAAC102599 [Brettanomyces naardenensis]
MSEIPEDSQIVHVVSALDFPLSVSKSVSRARDPSKIWYIITKGDAFFSSKSGLERTGLPYFRDSLARLVGADPDHVFLVSGKLGWGTEGLLGKLPGNKKYFVGGINSGKSTLVKTLIYRDDKTLRSDGHYGPGISEIPGFTAKQIKYQMKQEGGGVLIDTPGFIPKDRGVYQYLLKEDVKKVAKVAEYTSAKEGGHRAHSPVVKGKKVFDGKSLFSVGGFFYLKPPMGSVIQVFTGIPGVEAKYRDLQRLLDMNNERKKEIGHRFSVNEEAARNLVRYVIPPFYGKIDLVLKGVGYLTIVPCGKLEEGKLFQVYVPRGIEVVVRESIFGFIYKTRGGIDETGNKLAKKNVPSRGAVILRKIPKKKLVFTRLIEVPLEMCDEEAFSKVVPGTGFGVEGKWRSQEEFENKLWREVKL